MTHLYTCRHDGDQFRITQLSTDLDVVSSYLCSPTECQCPGFTSRGRCRHLEMLPRFMARPSALRGEVHYDFDRDTWLSTGFTNPEPASGAESSVVAATTVGNEDEGSSPTALLLAGSGYTPFQRRF